MLGLPVSATNAGPCGTSGFTAFSRFCDDRGTLSADEGHLPTSEEVRGRPSACTLVMTALARSLPVTKQTLYLA
jgi:hypothetical protein